ncbi:hypothetical protein [Corynebacterium sp. TAE3-ERU16]|uniref:hypothetical protein n=1 Tax=Corynebacterium sp. TAE3-ERU16 TaxID=2849493 RepID=UPI001C43FB7A|nr:hypothetical protein [Corynebacterium sp. TAE3-ERU16]MBV7294153.1 hypothetical protein [Corynebacterium sp. TAE3-ERU16]
MPQDELDREDRAGQGERRRQGKQGVPVTVPGAEVVPRIPMAVSRSRVSVKVTRMRGSVAGIIIAAPTADSEAAPNKVGPAVNIRR